MCLFLIPIFFKGFPTFFLVWVFSKLTKDNLVKYSVGKILNLTTYKHSKNIFCRLGKMATFIVQTKIFELPPVFFLSSRNEIYIYTLIHKRAKSFFVFQITI